MDKRRWGFFIFLLFPLLSSCDNINQCYYSEDIGNVGNTDIINLAAAENSCYYDTFKSYGENGNLTIKNCLSSTALTSIKAGYATIATDFNNVSSVNNSPIANAKCYDADFMDETKAVVGTQDVSLENAKASAKTIYQKCIDHCTSECESTSTSEEAMWTKANIKTDSTYVGIKLEENVFVTITATGSIRLDSTSSTLDMDFKKIGAPDTNYKPVSKGNTSLDLNVKVRKNIETSEAAKLNTMENLESITSKIYLDLTAAKEDLIPMSGGEQEIKMTQRPNFRTFTCNYTDIDEFQQYSVGCQFDYISLVNTIQNLSAEASSLANRLDSYYNDSSNWSKPAIFSGDYYKYANDAVKYIQKGEISAGGTGSPFANQEPNFVNMASQESSNSKTIYVKQKLGAEMLDSFLWNDTNESFRITLEKGVAVKIAIKYIGTRDSNDNKCNYTIEDPKRYIANDTTKTGEVTKGVYSITYDISSSIPEEKWQVLKDSDNNEIVFNQFLQEDNSGTGYTITIKNSNENNSPLCSRGLLIKLLRMKDYSIGNSGFMFFYVPGVTNSSGDVKYTLLNPNALTVNGMDLDAAKNTYYKIDEFFEYENNRKSFANEAVELLSSSEVENLDEGNFDAGMMSKSVFVRKGQKLRLDYSNWLTLDGQKDIEIKTLSTTTGSKPVGRGLGMSVFIEERPLYFCYGTAKETYNME
ncbi:MAG: hypothetical protein LBP39_03000, partial [Rickettsiales bacterium]|nr:hypothetical protein [Rickettsiales bacterium]